MTADEEHDPWGQGESGAAAAALNSGTPDAEQPIEEEEEPDFVFESVDDFVTNYLAKVVERRLNRATMIWCPGWWQHPEAIVRCTAMWRAFEYLRHDAALGMSTWWLQHADPHLRMLMDAESGPFVACDPRGGHADRPLSELPIDPSPPEMWDDPAFRVTPRDVNQTSWSPDTPLAGGVPDDKRDDPDSQFDLQKSRSSPSGTQ